MMSNECEAMGLPAPEYVVDRDIIKVIFRLPGKPPEAVNVVSFDELTPTELEIYGVIADGGVVTLEKMARSANVSQATVKRSIATLTEKGFVVRTGSRKSGIWAPNVKTTQR